MSAYTEYVQLAEACEYTARHGSPQAIRAEATRQAQYWREMAERVKARDAKPITNAKRRARRERGK